MILAMPYLHLSKAIAIAALTLAWGCRSEEGSAPSRSGAPAQTAAMASSAPAAPSATAKSSGAPAAAAQPPDAVVKSYLELGAAGDLSKIKDLVDPQCHATKVGEVDAVKMLGARMTLTKVTATLESEAGDTAKVKYSVEGSVDAKNVRSETDIFGKPVEIKAAGMTMSGVTQSGTLTLKKIDGRWVVTC